MMSLWKWVGTLDVSKSSAYSYIMQYQEELVNAGCLQVKRTPKGRRIYVLNGDCIVELLSKHGIYLKDMDSVHV